MKCHCIILYNILSKPHSHYGILGSGLSCTDYITSVLLGSAFLFHLGGRWHQLSQSWIDRLVPAHRVTSASGNGHVPSAPQPFSLNSVACWYIFTEPRKAELTLWPHSKGFGLVVFLVCLLIRFRFSLWALNKPGQTDIPILFPSWCILNIYWIHA